MKFTTLQVVLIVAAVLWFVTKYDRTPGCSGCDRIRGRLGADF